MASHTATGEWQSFELRMRRRRAERLVLRAAAAADQGHADQARACLEEARSLVPSLPGIEAVQQKLDAPARRSVPLRWMWKTALAAGVAIAAMMVAFALWRPVPLPILTAHDFRALSLAAPLAQPPASSVLHQAAAETAEVPLTEATDLADAQPLPAPSPVTIAAAVPAPTVPPVRADSSYLPPPTVRATLSPASSPASGTMLPSVMPAVPSPVPAAPPPSPSATPAIATAAIEPAPVATSAPAASVPAPVASTGGGQEEVRGTLDRYAAAYSDLDAAAAEQVWPGVNRTALSRAFAGLASQRVSLGNCRIDVNGAAAQASCAGVATWAPKVGDGSPRTEARRWTFDLARRGDSWQIVSARVQKR